MTGKPTALAIWRAWRATRWNTPGRRGAGSREPHARGILGGQSLEAGTGKPDTRLLSIQIGEEAQGCDCHWWAASGRHRCAANRCAHADGDGGLALRTGENSHNLPASAAGIPGAASIDNRQRKQNNSAACCGFLSASLCPGCSRQSGGLRQADRRRFCDGAIPRCAARAGRCAIPRENQKGSREQKQCCLIPVVSSTSGQEQDRK